MRTFLDILDTVSASIRTIVGFFVLLIFGGILVTTFGATYVATTATEEFAEKAETLGEQAIAAKATAERNQALGKEGWGYETNDSFGKENGPSTSRRSRRDRSSGSSDWGSGS